MNIFLNKNGFTGNFTIWGRANVSYYKILYINAKVFVLLFGSIQYDVLCIVEPFQDDLITFTQVI